VLLIWVPWRRQAQRWLAVVVLMNVAACVLTVPESRYFLPGLALLSVLLAQGIEAAPRRLRIGAVGAALLPVLLTYNVATTAWRMEQRVGVADYILGRESADRFLSDKVDYYRTVKYVNERTPPGSRVLFVGLGRGYYCRRDYEATSVTESNPLFRAIRSSATAEQAALALREQGLTHLLIRRAGLLEAQHWPEWHQLYGLSSDRDREVYCELLSDRHTPLVFAHAGIQLREIQCPLP